jgi:uncharacterized protein
MQKLKVSRYLQIVPRDKDSAVYHSLFGNLELVDAEGKKLLESFKTPNSFDTVAEAFDKYDPSSIWSYINDMRARNFLVPEGADEYELIEANYKSRRQCLRSGYLVRALQLVVTNYCNFKCRYCFVENMYNSKERAELQHLPSNMKMSVDVARQSVNNLLNLLEKNGHRYLNIEFFGGEPLMNWPVIEFVLETFKNGSPKGVEIIYSITTNGCLITKKIADVLKNYGVNVTVSFDAPSRIEKSVVKKEKGGEQVKRNLEILKANGNWVTFNSVISKETIAEFDGKALVDIAIYYHISMIGLILDLDLEFYKNPDNKEKVLEALFSTYRYGQSQGIPIVGYWHQIFNQVIGKQPLNLFSGYKTCPATGCKLSVEPAGHIFICKCCSGYMGHISDLDHVLASSQYESYALQAYRNSPDCDGCEIEGFCSGVCMGSLEKKYNKTDAIEKNSCDVFRGITRKLIEHVSTNQVEVSYLSTLSRSRDR